MAYQLGGLARRSIQIRDNNGALADATTVTVSFIRPDGTTDNSQTVTHPSTGNYYVDLTVSSIGRYVEVWTATGSNAGVFTDSFEVVGTADLPVVSLADLRKHLNWDANTDTSNDDELLQVAGSATDIIESNLGRPIRRKTVTEYHEGGGRSLLLRQVACPCDVCMPGRVLTISSVTVDGTAVTGYKLNPASGILYRSSRGDLTFDALEVGGVVVTYTTGYSATPSWATLAVKRLSQHLWNQTQYSRHTRGGAVAYNQTDMAPAATYLLPYAVQHLLADHQSPGW